MIIIALLILSCMVTIILRVEFQIGINTKTTTLADGSSTTTYSPTISFIDSVETTRFILICFDGISSDEVKELETSPLFFIVRIGRDSYEVLTQTPLKMKSPFR